MGRGNVCTHNECEGLYYLDRDLLDAYCKAGPDFEVRTARELNNAGIRYDYDGVHSGWAYDECESDDNWNDMVHEMRSGLMRRFKSFYEVDRWRDREIHVVLENNLFEIAVVDNEWSAAWCLLERRDIDGTNGAFIRRHYQTYLEAIKRILIENWGEAIGYGGAWTHGVRYTKADIA
jgi:hypothetical protein